MHLDTIINKFHSIIFTLMEGNDNILIGGSQALKIHGLNMHRELCDIDLVIYRPSEKQKELLKQYAFFDTIKDRPMKDYPNKIKAIKIEKEGLFLDIIVEEEMMPTDCLFHEYIGFSETKQYIPIQNIQRVIDAKNKYTLDPRVDGGNLIKYRRAKDMEDLLELKNNNFNLPK